MPCLSPPVQIDIFNSLSGILSEMVFRWEVSPGLSFSLEMSYISRVCQVESRYLFPIKGPLQGEYKGLTFPSGHARYGREPAVLLFNKIYIN